MTRLTLFDELAFRDWYRNLPQVHGKQISPDPDDPEHFYDWRGAFRGGNKDANVENHWPSEFKTPDHPRRMLGPIDTTSREAMGLADLLGSLRFR